MARAPPQPGPHLSCPADGPLAAAVSPARGGCSGPARLPASRGRGRVCAGPGPRCSRPFPGRMRRAGAGAGAGAEAGDGKDGDPGRAGGAARIAPYLRGLGWGLLPLRELPGFGSRGLVAWPSPLSFPPRGAVGRERSAGATDLRPPPLPLFAGDGGSRPQGSGA